MSVLQRDMIKREVSRINPNIGTDFVKRADGEIMQCTLDDRTVDYPFKESDMKMSIADYSERVLCVIVDALERAAASRTVGR